MAHSCAGCGDDFSSDMMFEGLAGKNYCAWCLGFDPEDLPEAESLRPAEVEKLFWKTERENREKESSVCTCRISVQSIRINGHRICPLCEKPLS